MRLPIRTTRTPRTDKGRFTGRCAAFAAVVLLAAMIASPTGARAQDPATPPFYQLQAGLYYPALEGFEEEFGISSDFIWGTGFGLPISGNDLYLLIELSWFQGNSYTPGPPAGEHEMSVAFWHLGLLNKVHATKEIAFRLQAGASYNSAELKFMPVGAEETKQELKRKFGFYGGAGIENAVFGGKMAFFVDFVYDYRRSTDPLIYGDFGGTRIVAGLTAFLF